MSWNVRLLKTSWLAANADRSDLLISYELVDSRYAYQLDEGAYVITNTIIVEISQTLVAMWRLGRQELEAQLVEHAKHFIASKLREGTINPQEEVTLSSYNAPNTPPFHVRMDNYYMPTGFTIDEPEQSPELRQEELAPIQQHPRASIFLSHSHADKPFVNKLANRLRQVGVKVWIDKAEIKIGDSLIQKISEAIEEMDFVGAVLSRNSVKSHWVQKELELAMNKEINGKRVVVLPIIIEACEIPTFIKGKLYANFTDEIAFDEEFNKILKAIGVDEVLLPNQADENAKRLIGKLDNLSFEFLKIYALANRIDPPPVNVFTLGAPPGKLDSPGFKSAISVLLALGILQANVDKGLLSYTWTPEGQSVLGVLNLRNVES